jgi:hypothetical protein
MQPSGYFERHASQTSNQSKQTIPGCHHFAHPRSTPERYRVDRGRNLVSTLIFVPRLINPQVYVDALGPTKPYEQYLTSQFPGINFTVTAKADSKYTIVGAASVAAKVTRDAWIEGWVFEEDAQQDMLEAQIKRTWSTKLGSGYPSGAYSIFFFCPTRWRTVRHRPEHKDLDQRISREDVRISFYRTFFVDDGQSCVRREGPRSKMVCNLLRLTDSLTETF